MQRWTCVAVSAYPARGPGRVNGAGAGVLWRAFLLSSPTHEPSKEARVCSLAAPGVLDLDPYPPPRHRPPPPQLFPGFPQSPPPSAGSEQLKGRLPSPRVQVTAGREAGPIRQAPGEARRSSWRPSAPTVTAPPPPTRALPTEPPRGAGGEYELHPVVSARPEVRNPGKEWSGHPEGPRSGGNQTEAREGRG